MMAVHIVLKDEPFQPREHSLHASGLGGPANPPGERANHPEGRANHPGGIYGGKSSKHEKLVGVGGVLTE